MPMADFCDFFKQEIAFSYDLPFILRQTRRRCGDNPLYTLTLDIIRRVIHDFRDEGSPV